MFLGFIQGEHSRQNITSEFEWTMLTVNRLRSIKSPHERFDVLNQLMSEFTRFRELSFLEKCFKQLSGQACEAYVYSLSQLRQLSHWLDSEGLRLKKYRTIVQASESIIQSMLTSLKDVNETIQHIIFMREIQA